MAGNAGGRVPGTVTWGDRYGGQRTFRPACRPGGRGRIATTGAATSAELERQLAELQTGGHLCMLYESEAERLDALVPFLRDGLARGECCLYVVGEQGPEPVFQALAVVGVDVHEQRARGALLVEPSDEVYLGTGSFDPQHTRDVWNRFEQQALGAGFASRRVAAEVPAVFGHTSELERWIAYEASLNHFLAGRRTLILCQYDVGRFTARGVLDVLRTHPIVVLGRRVCRNPYYELPDLVLDPAPDAERVGWMLDQLRRLHDREQEAGALHRATLAIGGELDLDARLERVLDAALELTGAEHARIILEVPQADEVEFAAVRGMPGRVAGQRQPRAAGLIGTVLAQNRPMRVGDAQADPRTWDRESLRRSGIRSWLGVPLADGHRPFGVLLVVSQAVDRFGEEDEGRLLSLAALAGSAIREARLRRQLEQELDERLQALVQRALLAREQEQRRLRGIQQLEHLTRRERETLALLARGLTTRQIAEQLVIGPGTVKGYIERVLSKLGVANRAQAAARAMELGLLDEHQPATAPGTDEGDRHGHPA